MLKWGDGMKLINNEEAQRNIERHRTKAMEGSHEETEERMKGYNPSSFLAGLDYGMELACKLIASEPTVDAVPVVRGEWKQLYEEGEDEAYACSVCGKIWFLYGTPVDNGMNFCPKCGADMRKKVE